MVISTRPLIDLVPVQPAAMAGRQICQWDKDSCGDAGFLKIDLLGLGMLSAVEDAIDRIARLRGETIDLSRVPLDDPGVYEEIQPADTVGVFQIESRAQMQSLLQTRPENLDDLTVQVALVRPGPIQGKAVHPYVKHRHAKRADPSFEPPVEHESLREALRDTLGVVVFQDQVLDVAMAAAGFSIGEAEGLRRAMSSKRSEEAIEAFRPRFVAGLPRQRHRRADRARDLRQARRLRRLRLPEVACGRVRAARVPVGVAAAVLPGGVPVRADERAADGLLPAVVARARRAAARGGGACRRTSTARRRECDDRGRRRAGRARLRPVGRRGGRAVGRRAAAVRGLGDLARRATVKQDALEALVAAGACDEWGPRRELLWRLGVTPRGETVGGGNRQLALPLEPTAEIPELPEQTPWERMLADYKHTSLSVGVHPLELLRPHLPAGVATSADLPRDAERRADPDGGHGDRAAAAGDGERRSSSCCSRTSTARRT